MSNLLQPPRFYAPLGVKPYVLRRTLEQDVVELRDIETAFPHQVGKPLELKSQAIYVWWNVNGTFARCGCGERSRYYIKTSRAIHKALTRWAEGHRCLSPTPGVPVDVPIEVPVS